MLGPNIQAFREHNVIGVFEEAQYQSGGAEFDEMKAWVANKLLWYLQLIIPQYFISNKSGIWSLSLIVHSKG